MLECVGAAGTFIPVSPAPIVVEMMKTSQHVVPKYVETKWPHI